MDKGTTRNRRCTISGCIQKHCARGYCSRHWTKWKKYGDPLADQRRLLPEKCQIDGCTNPPASRGWCDIHYCRWKRHGNPLIIKRTGKKLDAPPIGKKFSKLTVVGLGQPRRAYNRNYSQTTWLCLCDCGNSIEVLPANLRNGKTRIQTCGCRLEFSDQEVARHSFFTVYKGSAKKRHIPFEITESVFAYLTSQDCHYCGDAPSHEHFTRFAKSVKERKQKIPYICNGIDRKDSSIGYTLENCVPCCTPCNLIKRTAKYEEFIARCQRISSIADARDLEKLVDYDPSKSYV